MRLFRHILLMLLVAAAMLSLPAAQVPLTLTASIDHDVLLATPRQNLGGLFDKPSYTLESAKITLTFTNTGDASLKLNTYDLVSSRLQLAITAQDKGSVIQQPVLTDLEMLPPREKDFPVLPPGASWTMATPITFPKQEIGITHYLLQRPGLYRLRFLYHFSPSKAELWDDVPMAAGAFQGMVAANTVSVKLVEASEPVNGLQIGLDAQPSTDVTSGDVRLVGYLRNTSDKPMTINAWDLFHEGVQFMGDDGKLLPYSGGNDRSRTASLAERYPTLAPGETRAFPIRAAYRPRLDTLTAQMGDFGAEDDTGYFRNWPVQGASCCAYAVLESPTGPGLAKLEAIDTPAPLWKGTVTSPIIVIPFNPTAYRQARLKQEVAHFALALDYAGDQPKPYYTLHLQVQPDERKGTPAYYRSVQITTPEALALIDYLAKSGALRDAIPIATVVEIAQRRSTGYVMSITADMPGNGAITGWSLALGWDLAMYRQLLALRAQIPAHGQPDMDTLLTSISGMHDQWLAEDALRQPVVTLDTPAGTFSEAANAISAALHCPQVYLTINADAGLKPVAAYHFFNVTANEAFKSLAAAANVNYFANGPNTIFTPLNLIVD